MLKSEIDGKSTQAILRPVLTEEDIPPAQEDVNIDEGEIRLVVVVVKAIKQLKNYKAPGKDASFPEMFKVEDRLVFILKISFNEVWVVGIIPLGWKNGVIIKFQIKEI